MITSPRNPLTRWLAGRNALIFNLYAGFAAFSTYFCMYAFRKPFSVATYPGTVHLPFLPPMDLKVFFVISQVLGYAVSKFVGIKVCSEAPAQKRAQMILWVIGASELALLGFAMVPEPWNALFLFANGFPLGMVWGLVFSFLEGRKTTEFLGAFLSTSFILASGAVKSVGHGLMEWGVPEYWMPFVTGLVFAVPLVVSTWGLKILPDPTPEDEALRTRREPMGPEARKKFLLSYAPGLICLTLFYTLLTAYRDFRDNFAREIWDSVGYGGDTLIYTRTELPIALIVLAVLAAVMWVKDNRRGVAAIHGLLVVGTAMIGVSTWAWQQGWMGPVLWMTLVGLGLYLGYVPFGSALFDRIIAETKFVGTAVFMIYVADASGYAGSVAVMLFKNFGQSQLSWLGFFISFSYLLSLTGTVGFLLSGIYFYRKGHRADIAPLQDRRRSPSGQLSL